MRAPAQLSSRISPVRTSFGVSALLLTLTLLTTSTTALAAPRSDLPVVVSTPAGIEVHGHHFPTWGDYVRSDFFRDHGMRCGVPPTVERRPQMRGTGADCTYTLTNPSADYDPSVQRYRIPVVVHVITSSSGEGNLTAAQVQSQIEILNEDFGALPGTPGEPGTDASIEFYLATQDPSGAATTGITYSANDQWFQDQGNYWDSLAWDTSRYVNIYTNTASGALGYVPDLPQGGIAGSNADRVVVLWSAFGRDAAIGAPLNQGRTATHELGHYLGLEHTFNGGCAAASSCNSNGDLICDTNPEAEPTYGCSDSRSCGSPDPIRNYMDYTDDTCMNHFSPEQVRRMRCSLEHYRSDLFEAVDGGGGGGGETCAVTTSVQPAGAGSVSGDGSGDCGRAVSLVASANAGYEFERWAEDGVTVSTSASYGFALPADRQLVAHFAVSCVREPGDVNGDGRRDGTDVVCLRRSLVGLSECGGHADESADYDGDGNANSTDVVRLRRCLLALEPCEECNR